MDGSKSIPLHILVVDDDHVNRRMMDVMLSSQGHALEFASNGIEALEAVKDRKFDTNVGRADATTVANVTADLAVQTAPDTVQIHGTPQDAAGLPLPVDQLEQRLVSPGNLFDLNGRRTLRANSALPPGNLDGTLAYDAAGSINWTATYTGLSPADVTRALAAESRIHWLGADPAAGVEATIFEIGAGITAGPAAPCTAPLESLPPPPGSELEPPSVPQNLTATVGNSNTVTLSWDASTDNIGVTAYGLYRNGLAIANVQNSGGTAPAPTTPSRRISHMAHPCVVTIGQR